MPLLNWSLASFLISTVKLVRLTGKSLMNIAGRVLLLQGLCFEVFLNNGEEVTQKQ